MEEITKKKDRVVNTIEKKRKTGMVIITELMEEIDRRKILERDDRLQKEYHIKVKEDLSREARKRKWRIRKRGKEEKNKGKDVW